MAFFLLLLSIIAIIISFIGMLIIPSGIYQIICFKVGCCWVATFFAISNLAAILEPFFKKDGRISNTICLILTTPFIWGLLILISIANFETIEGIAIPAVVLITHIMLVGISQLAYFYSWQFSANFIVRSLLGIFYLSMILVLIFDYCEILSVAAKFIFVLSNFLLFLTLLFGLRNCFCIAEAKKNWVSLSLLFTTVMLMIVLYSTGWIDQINSHEYSKSIEYFLGISKGK